MKLTYFIFFSNILTFIFSLFNPFIVEEFSFNKKSFFEGKYYLPLTCIFFHVDVYHLIYNLIALLLVGTTVEERSGKLLFLTIYLLSGYIGAISLILYKENFLGLGASAAISGLIGFGAIKFPTTIVLSPIGIIMPLPFIVVGAIFLVINLLGLFIPSQIGFLSHLFGLFTGVLIALTLVKEKTIRFIVFLTLAALFFYLLASLPNIKL
ncbi:MAG: rhomboid family intramembrane serine protease [Candidatus Aenigmarchaeota archaeon]|nr:rhomboid family intramembrane serine protease [Candidatus Aenigmarchaeota archaeon]MDW8149442.1 rhomboid family intramembrane serine protease [Candidatus Aenigmarchaeota archaeon]